MQFFTSNAAYFVDDIKCHFGSSMISGLVTTLVSMPVDIAKTRFGHVCFLPLSFKDRTLTCMCTHR